MRGHTEIQSDIHARRSACPPTVSLSAGRNWLGVTGLSEFAGEAEEANKHKTSGKPPNAESRGSRLREQDLLQEHLTHSP
jgi:hypothetical protein